MSFNLAAMLTEATSATPDKTLVYLGDEELSYAQIDEASGRLAATLRKAGYGPGDAVAVQLPNIPQFLIAYFGLLKAGMVMVPLNPLLAAREVAYHLDDSDSRALITFDQFAASAMTGAAGDAPVYVVGETPQGALPFEELLVEEDTGEVVARSSDDTAVRLYTSGTTGSPKGAELTHFQLYMNCTVAGSLFGIRSDDISVGVLPLFHVFGLSSVLNVAVRYGGSLVLVPRFDAEAVVRAIEDHGATVFAGVPTMYMAMLQADTEGRDVSSLRAASSGGASIPGEVIRAFEEKFPGVIVLEGYGLSETAATCTFNISAEERKVLSVGKPIWGVDVKIINDDGESQPQGSEHRGEVLVRGHNVMKEYYKRSEATEEALRDGWLHTGDVGYLDEDGFLFIVDRLKDLVIRGGYNVYPREVEEELYTHPAVAEAAVVGREDARLGEEVVAYVSLKPGRTTTEDELIAYCKERLAAYKYPRAVSILSELPKGPTGKILKRELKV
ncbi:long-chain-fatty-acid--CoA ligase [Corynebacterium sp. CNJ-954]|jgi:long-chain acyl-CoA synthetase|uniref:long-chain-fatty-acid--CoA ligase n=1 Tax=Corynebacterium sp. CNJ-954 TaxID=1904962 RepID=UPI0009653FDB|nr:long-chain fatty acid--CoA ligase [Corynebacterium sp. CNJ-954]OLT55494.1 long-chain-fatty-acid--CoA ligase [Corynebacterium sp. CNJ-954]